MSTFVDVNCALRRKDSLCAFARWFCISRKGGTGGGGWGHLQGDLHMLAVCHFANYAFCFVLSALVQGY